MLLVGFKPVVIVLVPVHALYKDWESQEPSNYFEVLHTKTSLMYLHALTENAVSLHSLQNNCQVAVIQHSIITQAHAFISSTKRQFHACFFACEHRRHVTQRKCT
jgi:hypothetical protein